MRKLDCLRCGTTMAFARKEHFQLGKTGIFLGDLPNLMAGSLEMEIYCCPKCGKLEFFRPDDGVYTREEEVPDDLPPEATSQIVGVSRDGVPQVRCPACGKNHDFDYPRCPYCEHPYNA